MRSILFVPVVHDSFLNRDKPHSEADPLRSAFFQRGERQALKGRCGQEKKC
jgi:hypothetical protein